MSLFLDPYYIGGTLVAFELADILILYVISKKTGKKFDRLLQEHNIPYPISLNFFYSDKLNRANCYAILILLFKNPIGRDSSRYRRYRKRFGDFYFRKHAVKEDIILATIHVTMLSFMATILITMFIMAYLK